MAGKNRISASN